MKFTQKVAGELVKKYTEKITNVVNTVGIPKSKNDMLGAINQCIGIFQDYSKKLNCFLAKI